MAWGASNREEPVEGSPWIGRADRAQRNHHDNLAMIAVVIVLAQVTGQADGVTANAAIAILACRVLHGVAYIVGIPPLRTLAYVGSLVGLGTIVWRILV